MKMNAAVFNKKLMLLFFLISMNNLVYAKETLILGVHPFLSHKEIEKKFTPLANYLSKQTNIDIRVKVGSSYAEHIRYIGEDMVDIAYMGPASFVNTVNQFGRKQILAKLEVNGYSYFQGNIVVRQDSGIKSLEELKGRRIAFGDPNSTMSYIVPHHMLHQAGVFSDKAAKHDFLNSHNNVALGVLSGNYVAGAVKPSVFKKFEAQGLSTISVTPKISEHLFVTRSTLPAKQVKALRQAMLNIKKSSEGMSALHTIKKSITNLVKATDRDYDNLSKIIIDSKILH